MICICSSWFPQHLSPFVWIQAHGLTQSSGTVLPLPRGLLSALIPSGLYSFSNTNHPASISAWELDRISQIPTRWEQGFHHYHILPVTIVGRHPFSSLRYQLTCISFGYHPCSLLSPGGEDGADPPPNPPSRLHLKAARWLSWFFSPLWNYEVFRIRKTLKSLESESF